MRSRRISRETVGVLVVLAVIVGAVAVFQPKVLIAVVALFVMFAFLAIANALWPFGR
jgi:hypothetical protein